MRPHERPNPNLKESKMYHLATNDNWFNGMKFTSLATAVAKQQAIIEKNPGITVDVMRHEDGKVTRVVCTSDSSAQNITLIR